MDLKSLEIGVIATAVGTALVGGLRVIYVRFIKRDEQESKRLTDQQDHSQEREISDRAEMLRALKSQLKAMDTRVKHLEDMLERYQTERVEYLTTIARLETKCEGLERENKDLRRQVGLHEASEPGI